MKASPVAGANGSGYMRLSAEPTVTALTVARTPALAPEVQTSDPWACPAAATESQDRVSMSSRRRRSR